MAIVTDGVIKVWYGIVRGDREYLTFRRMEPDEIRSTLTIEHAAANCLTCWPMRIRMTILLSADCCSVIYSH
jgi:hypothetical protein